MNSWHPELKRRFWSKVDQGTGCWIWIGYRDKYGYGRFRSMGIDIKSHRASYWITFGVLPDLLRHDCDNPPCVNPHHLRPGTRKDNARDAVERGQHKGHPRKFSLELESLIRKEYSLGGISYRSLAIKYETSYGHIQLIMERG